MPETTFDFGDGRDAVPARQHPNGGGRIAAGVEVPDSVYVGPAARIMGGEFYGGVFRGGVFRGGEFLGGVFCGGLFHGGVFRGGLFHGGVFRGGEFLGGVFCGGLFHDGVFRGGLFHDGVFRGGEFRGGEFRGGVFRDGTFFCSGVLPHNAVISAPNELSIGCVRHSLDHWARHVREIATNYGYDEKQISLTEQVVQLATAYVEAGLGPTKESEADA
ncbi:hypothetical protein LCGC14_0719100 [marine sediment metagenome]|uniref:Uncharacterized protein n=1 Tax=marine sediment metagenome TaxID=412755 RepID=A0A0F9QCZ4_9ZZZZ